MSGFMDGITPQTVAQASDGFKLFKIGDNHARISNVTERTTKNGDPMLEINFIDEDGANIRYYIVKNEFGESKLKQLFLAFNIPFANLYNYQSWLNKWGVVVCKEGKPYNGNVYPEVSYVRPAESRQANSQPQRPQQQQQPHPQQTYNPPAGQTQQDDEFEDDIPF